MKRVVIAAAIDSEQEGVHSAINGSHIDIANALSGIIYSILDSGHSGAEEIKSLVDMVNDEFQKEKRGA